MLSFKVLTRRDGAAVSAYYADGADDYYAKEGDASSWQGKGAELLGLSGQVDAERFKELLAGRIDADTLVSRGSTRTDSKTRIGIDLTFSAPKSVSIQALVAGDVNLVKAHDLAVARAIELAEMRAEARSKKDGKSAVERTGNLIVAKFRHETSRERDPQLHTHAVAMNLTRRADGQWRALRNDELVRATKFLGAAYRVELARELQRLGYELRTERDGMFELAHITRDQLEAFSRRSTQIAAALEQAGKSRETATAAEKQRATMKTRTSKVSMDRAAIHAEWKGMAKELAIELEPLAVDRAKKPYVDRPNAVADLQEQRTAGAVRFAIKHLSERRASFSGSDLFDVALKHAVGAGDVAEVSREIRSLVANGSLIQEDARYQLPDARKKFEPMTAEDLVSLVTQRGMHKERARTYVRAAIAQGRLRAVEPRYTTQAALERERNILTIERGGRRKFEAVMSADRSAAATAGLPLTVGQRAAIEMVLTSRDSTLGVVGYAGVGKSHMLRHKADLLQASGVTVRALAPYATQVKALRELGMQANTVASFLVGKDKALDPGSVLVVDEAGTLASRQLEQLMRITESQGARLVLMGDPAQTKAIEAGRPFEQLLKGGMTQVAMTEIQRQKSDELLRAVELAIERKSVESLARVPQVIEIKDAASRHQAIATAYIEMTPQERTETIIVSGTNASRRDINNLVRRGLGLEGHGTSIDTLVRRDTTQAERRFARYYREGDVISPDRDYQKSGLRRGELYTITGTGPGNQLHLKSHDGMEISINPMNHAKLSVYEKDRREFSPGDLVRINHNQAALDLANGDRFTVSKIAEHSIELMSATRTVALPTNKALHIEPAYAVTVHSSQGLTADRVIANFDTRSRTTAADTYYVGISRARMHAAIYTDRVKELPAAISRENVKEAALDLNTRAADRAHSKQRQAQLERDRGRDRA